MAQEQIPLNEMTLRQLRKVASDYAISRYSRMRKSELMAAIQEKQGVPIVSSPSPTLEAKEEVEASKFEVGVDESKLDVVQEEITPVAMAAVDGELPDLPEIAFKSQ